MVDLSSPGGTYPNDLIFTSSHVLTKNHWHHVCIQWSNTKNNSSGSIFIDDNETNFHIPSSSVSANSNLEPSGLVLGNYYIGNNTNLANLLNNSLSTTEGFTSINHPAGVPTVNKNTFSHPLNAEMHEFKIYNKVLANPETLLETDEGMSEEDVC